MDVYMHMEPKAMEYSAHDMQEDIAAGDYRGHQFVVRNLGTHPTAYVSVQNGKALDTDAINCHGGITWVDNFLPNTPPDRDMWWIGWDYAHYGDWIYVSHRKPMEYEKCWTTKEIIEECCNVIDQLEGDKND